MKPSSVRSMAMVQFVLFIFLCYFSTRFADAYDPVDPLGNITINWDFTNMDSAGYTVMVSIHNNQLYRHIERPGWRLGWAWVGHEIIWNVLGGETTEQGNCSGVQVPPGIPPPHCCEKRPVMADLPPGAPYNTQVANCCRGGVLSSLTQNNRTATAAFQMYVGNFDREGGQPAKPTNFSIGVPGYTCSNVTDVPPTKSKVDGQRHVQVLRTWQITCSYSQFRESASPSCCVALTTFYNSTIVGCPQCSCGCPRSPSAPQCLGDGEQSKVQALPDADGNPPAPIIRCTKHMCPIKVHWHVKQSYQEYWRVKMTITNYDVVSNYSDWNLVVRHPNLANLTQLFSFTYRPLMEYGAINDTAMFWGLPNYNEMLLQDGNVQSEMILKKDPSDFTFSGGWAFPRRVYFNGHQCAMPSPDQYPSLPNAASDVRASAVQRWLIAGSCLLLLYVFHVV